MKEKIKTIYSILGLILLVLLIIIAVIWILGRVEMKINFKAITFSKEKCEKNLLIHYFDPNQYLKDLYSPGVRGGLTYFPPRYKEVSIKIMSLLMNKTEDEIKKIVYEEYSRLRSLNDWDKNNPLKVQDLVGNDIDWDYLANQEQVLSTIYNSYCSVTGCCNRPSFFKIRLKDESD